MKLRDEKESYNNNNSKNNMDGNLMIRIMVMMITRINVLMNLRPYIRMTKYRVPRNGRNSQ